jgi:hypothetical protein
MNVHNLEKHHGNIGYTRQKTTKKIHIKTPHQTITAQYVLNITMRKQTQITLISPPYKQLGVQRNKTS